MSPMSPLDPAVTGFDFDGVIADTVAAFAHIVTHDYGIPLAPADFTNFDAAPVDREILNTVFTYLTDEPVAGGIRPMPGAAETLTALARTTPLTIVTARPDAAPVEDWLTRFFDAATCERIRVIATGDHDDKMSHVQAAGLSAFIDDRAETCLTLAEAGIDARIFAQPWNQRHAGLLPVVRDWRELARLFDAKP